MRDGPYLESLMPYKEECFNLKGKPSEHRMKRYKDDGSPYLIPLDGYITPMQWSFT